MNVPSGTFLCFAAIVALLMHVGRAAWWRRCVLLVANVTFLASFSRDPLAWLPYATFMALGYLGLSVMQSSSATAKRLLAPLCAMIVVAFVSLKHYTFVPQIMFPPFPYAVIGLSYVFFRVLHLIIDSRNEMIPERVDLISYLNYSLDFSSLVSGPIQRYQDYHRSISDRPAIDVVGVGNAIERIVVGFFKVAVLSHLVLAIHDGALRTLAPEHSLPSRVNDATIVTIAYPIYLYCNFSGYTDFVIGVARFIGLQLPENFDRPFSAENFINFWSRWHITLSTWLKTYVYAPLLMSLARRFPSSKAEPGLAVIAFFVTFFLIGVWHGRTSVFIAFGCLQGFGVAANKLYQIAMARRLGRAGYRSLGANARYRAFARGLTFTWFAFTLFWFWSNWQQMGMIVRALGPAGLGLTAAAVLLGAVLMLAGLEAARARVLSVSHQGQPVLLSRYVRTVSCTVLVVVSAAATALLNLPAPDIVYRAF